MPETLKVKIIAMPKTEEEKKYLENLRDQQKFIRYLRSKNGEGD